MSYVARCKPFTRRKDYLYLGPDSKRPSTSKWPQVFSACGFGPKGKLLQALFTNYDQLDEDIKAELPLKRIWLLAAQEDE
jgi:hypothetical protein